MTPEQQEDFLLISLGDAILQAEQHLNHLKGIRDSLTTKYQ